MKQLITLLSVLALSACGKAGAPAAPASPLDTAARRTCMDTIEARAINRNSIDYLAGGASPVVPNSANGQLDLSIKFSAKNEIGMASTLLARCLVSPDGKKLLEITVKDSR